MTNKQLVEYKLQSLSNMVNIPCTRQAAKDLGAKEFLHLDNYPMYGGYNLVLVDIQSGGHGSFARFPSCGGRVNAQTMVLMINSFMDGLQYNK